MDKCRICLNLRKQLSSIYETERNSTFADMIFSVTNIKILNIDGVSDQICLRCIKKLREAYEFIKLIKSSNSVVQQSADVKRIHFDSISDVKFDAELFQVHKENLVHLYNSNRLNFKDGESMISYNDIIIRKVGNSNHTDNTQNCSNPVDVLDFLETIKNETDSDIDYSNHDVISETEFGTVNIELPLKQTTMIEGNVHIKQDEFKSSENNKSTYFKPIKPVMLKDDIEYSTVEDFEFLSKQRKNKRKAVKECDLQSRKSKGTLFKPIKPIFLTDIRVMAANRRLSKTRYKYKSHIKREICPYCGRFSTQLTTHMLMHTGARNFKCDTCGKGYFTKKNLEKHVLIHSTIKNFKCSKCVASFRLKESLKSHMLSHTDERNYTCDICRKAFKRKSALSRHVMIHSFSCKTIKCELCTMSFLTKYSLKHHMRVHTGERPYRCEICSQPYSYKHDFNRHCFKKHGVFLKRRSVYIMNDEVLKRERALMRELMLKTRGIMDVDKELNPFEGPQASQAFEQAVRALQDRQISVIDQQQQKQ